MDVAAERRTLVAGIRKAAKKGGDSGLQKYLGSPVRVNGLSVPAMRAILAAFRKGHPESTAKEINRLAAALFSGTTFEEKSLAIALLDRYAPILDDESWRLLDRFVDDCMGWGMCDAIGAGPIAKMVHDDPGRFTQLGKWAKSSNPWRRRIALYALHDFVLAKEFDKPFRLLETLIADEAFWVQRAVGTWLRECWKRDTPRTEAFLRQHVKGLPKVVITVATERALRSALREGGPAECAAAHERRVPKAAPILPIKYLHRAAP